MRCHHTLLRMTNMKNSDHTSAGGMHRHWISLTLLVQIWHEYLNCLKKLFWACHYHRTQDGMPRHFSYKNENKICMWTYGAVFFIVAANWKQPAAFDGWKVKQTVVHPHHKPLPKVKRNYWSTQQPNDSLENKAEWKEPVLKSCILYESIYLTFLKWQNYRIGEEFSGYRMIRGVKQERGGVAVWDSMKDPMVMEMSIFWLSKSIS